MRGLTPRVFEDLFARIEELKANVEVRLHEDAVRKPGISDSRCSSVTVLHSLS